LYVDVARVALVVAGVIKFVVELFVAP